MTRVRAALAALALLTLAACDGTTAGSGPVSQTPATLSSPTGPATSPLPSTSATVTKGVVDPVTRLNTLTGNATTVALDAGFVRALVALRLTPGPTGTAKVHGSALSLPVTGGTATVDEAAAPALSAQGVILHNGSGITFTGGAAKVSITNPAVDLTRRRVTATVRANGRAALTDLPVFELDLSTLRAPALSSGVVTVAGATAYSTSELVKVLDSAFKTEALSGGRRLKIGVLTSELTGR